MAQQIAAGETPFPLKILTIGDSAVGKTCLIMRFTGEDFVSSFITTVGIGKLSCAAVMGSLVSMHCPSFVLCFIPKDYFV